MYAVTIDPTRCAKDGACAAVCTIEAFQWRRGQVPTIGDLGPCYLCGHCIAVCPQDAIEHSGLTGQEYPLRPKGLRIAPHTLLTLMRARRSVREWRNRPVPMGIMEQLLEAGRFAPTGANSMHVGFNVALGRDRIRELDHILMTARLPQLEPLRYAKERPNSIARLARKLPRYDAGDRDLVLHDAPALVVVHAPVGSAVNDENCHYAAMQMILLAESLSLGTCIIAFVTHGARENPDVAAALGVPPDRRVGTAFTLGYPKFRYHRLAARNPANVTWI